MFGHAIGQLDAGTDKMEWYASLKKNFPVFVDFWQLWYRRQLNFGQFSHHSYGEVTMIDHA